MTKIERFLNEYRTPKKALAEMIGINQTVLYFFLEPDKYPDRVVSENAIAKIAAFENKSVKSIREDYEARKAGAA